MKFFIQPVHRRQTDGAYERRTQVPATAPPVSAADPSATGQGSFAKPIEA